MKIGIIGSGVVGQVIGKKLVETGQDVVLGTRSPDNLDDKRGMGNPLGDWLEQVGSRGCVGTFVDSARFGEILFNATAGVGSIEALHLAGVENLDGKILIDISNPLDFTHGMPPTLTVCNTDSLGEQIQRAFPGVKVVKTLNTVTARVMVDPSIVAGGDHHLFVSGNDSEAKIRVAQLLREWFGWQHIIDLGDITTARGTEMVLPLWLSLWDTFDTPLFNFKIIR